MLVMAASASISASPPHLHLALNPWPVQRPSDSWYRVNHSSAWPTAFSVWALPPIFSRTSVRTSGARCGKVSLGAGGSSTIGRRACVPAPIDGNGRGGEATPGEATPAPELEAAAGVLMTGPGVWPDPAADPEGLS